MAVSADTATSILVRNNEMLLQEWSRLAGAQCSAILNFTGKNQGNVLSLFPPVSTKEKAPHWLEIFLKCMLRSNDLTSIKQLSFSTQTERYHAVLAEVDITEESQRIVVFCFFGAPQEWQILCVNAFAEIVRFSEEEKKAVEERRLFAGLSRSVAITSEVNRAATYRDAALKLVNSVVAEWKCVRVSLGCARGWGVKLSAVSNMSSFDKRMQLLKDLKEAMLESMDQNIEVVFPQGNESRVVSYAASVLSRKHEVTNSLALPLRYQGAVVGGLLLERDSGESFSQDDCDMLRLMLELLTPRMTELEHRSRWVGARALVKLKKAISWVLGSEHTWAKLFTLCTIAAIVFFIFARGEYNIDASFVLQPEHKRIIAAPYNSFLKSVMVKPADKVIAGKTLLGELETDELILQRAQVFADELRFAKESAEARSNDKTVESQIAEAKAREAAAKLELLNLKLKQAKLIAPVSGYISSHEIDLQIGSPLKQGDILFEILPTDRLEVELYVPEGQIAAVSIGQRGQIAVMGYPHYKVEITVIRISPVSNLFKEQNSFKVTALLAEKPEWMKPGMEGVGKIAAGERNLFWIWTREAINWIRLKLWI